MKSSFKLAPLATAFLLAGISVAHAAPDQRLADLESKLQRSLDMIEQLQSKVRALEQKPAPEATKPVETVRVEQLEKQVADLGTGLSRVSSDTGIPLHGFADVGLMRTSEKVGSQNNGNTGANLGNLSFYLTPNLGSNVRSLMELTFEIDKDGKVATDLERLQAGYVFNDYLTAWVGRFHSPYGYWNTAFHHGGQIQTSVTRPRFLDFEDKGGIMPAHTTGIWLTGVTAFNRNRIGYDLTLGNAPTIEKTGASNPGTLDMRMGGNTSHATSTGLNLWYSPAALPDLRLGVHALRANVRQNDTVGTNLNSTTLNMTGGYAVFISDQWELLAEYYGFNNTDKAANTGSHQSNAWYVQAGYNLGTWTPYVRQERTGLNQADPYFRDQENGRSYSRSAIGLRYDLTPTSALKFELARTNQRDLGSLPNDQYSVARAQFAVRF